MLRFAALCVLVAAPVQAATITVTTVVNAVADDGACSFREAVQAANTDAAVDVCPAGDGADTIRFSAKLPGLDFDTSGSEIVVSGPLTIEGLVPGQGRVLFVPDEEAARVFRITAGPFTLADADILAGSAENGACVLLEAGVDAVFERAELSGCEAERSGGAIYNTSGTLTLVDVVVSDSFALGAEPGEGGGGIYNAGTLVLRGETLLSSNGTSADGGAVYNAGTLTAERGVSIDSNEAERGGGVASAGTAVLDGIELNSNRASLGGGLFVAAGAVRLTGGDVNSNQAFVSGGNVWVGPAAAFEADGALLSDARADGTEAGEGGGNVYSEGDVAITGGVVNFGSALGVGGGLLVRGGTAVIDGATLEQNDAGQGGAVAVEEGEAQLVRARVVNNQAGVSRFEPNGPGLGASASVSGGTLTLRQSLLAGGEATSAGGGLYLSGGSVDAENVTLSGNTAPTGAGADVAGGTLRLSRVTVTANAATAEGGGVQGAFTLVGSVLAGNAAPNGPDCAGEALSEDFNVVGSAEGCAVSGATASTVVGEDAGLGPLAQNGGPTESHALLAESPAVDLGGSAPAVDQRGFGRTVGPADAGAYERNAAPVAIESDPHPAGPMLALAGPNPSAGRTAVRLIAPVSGRVEVSLYDALGRRMQTLYAGSVTASVPVVFPVESDRLPPGVYVVRALGLSEARPVRLTVAR